MADATADDQDEDLRARVLAWMESTGRGYKAASKEFGVPRTTIRRWRRGGAAGRAQTERLGEADLRAHAGAPAPAREELEEDLDGEPSEGEDWIGFLRRKVAESDEAFRIALEMRHTSSMVRLQDLAVRYREKLELALRAKEPAERSAGDLPDPADLAREMLELAPLLGRLQPELARQVAATLTAEAGSGT